MKFVSIALGFLSISLVSTELASAHSYDITYVRTSFYSSGHLTASGERFDPNGYTAASRTLPFGTRLRLINPATGREVTVRVNDRGPYVRGRGLDLARGAAAALGMIKQGTAILKIMRLN